jgi:hypothetical protein
LVKRVETGLEAMTHNLIQNHSVIKDQDRVLRGIESRLDTVQDQVGETPLGLSVQFVAPTLNGRVAILAEEVSSLQKPGNLLETQVITWVNSWWKSSPSPRKIEASGKFSQDCEMFLTSLVTSFQKNASEVSALASKVKTLTSSSIPSTPSFSTSGMSTFANLQSSLGASSFTGVQPGATAMAAGAGGASSSSAIQSAQAITIADLE